MIFQLTFHFQSSPKIVAFKKFRTVSSNRGWGFAKRWQDNYLAICGKNHLGEIVERYSLERIDGHISR